MRSIFLLVIAIVVSQFNFGCGTRSLRVVPKSSEPQEGVVYSLPTTLLRVTVPYTVITVDETRAGIRRPERVSIKVRNPVRIEPLLAPDDKNLLVIQGGELTDNALLETTSSIDVASNLLLTGIDVNVTDKSPQVLEGILSSAIKVAKIGVMAGYSEIEPVRSIEARLVHIDQMLTDAISDAPVDAQLGDATGQRIASLVAERKMLLEIVRHYEMTNSQTVQESDVEYSVVLDPSDPAVFKEVQGKGYREHRIKPPSTIFGLPSAVPDDPVAIRVYKSEAEMVQARSQVLQEVIPGIPYRSGLPVRVQVTIGTDNTVTLDQPVHMAQFGSIMHVDAKFKPWGNMKTIAKFDETTGGLTKYSVTSTSSAEAAASALSASMDKVQVGLSEIARLEQERIAADSASELKALQSEKALIEARLALERAKRELADYKATQGIP